MEQKEIWKPVVGFEGYYEVSNLGRVASLKRGKRTVMTPSCSGKGDYLKVTFYHMGKQTTPSVHRLVAEAFLPNPQNLREVNHKDENKHNNRLDNLEWCTSRYNSVYGTLVERRIRIATENQGRPVNQLSLDGKVIASFPSISSAERETGIRNICPVCKGKRPIAGGFLWEYAKKSK